MYFRPNGYLFRDFDDVFSTVFSSTAVLKGRTLEILSSGSYDGVALAEKLGTARNGQFSEMMDGLVMAGFAAADAGMTGSVRQDGAGHPSFAILDGMERIATDTYSFERLRQDGYVYVDKTGGLFPLVDGSRGTQFFIARPRRFGKSLAVSTLQCLFEGRRDLFRGLEIESKWDWSRSWPVLRLDMGSCQAETVPDFWAALDVVLESESRRLGVALRGANVPARFRFLIDDLAARSADGRTVLLVDEYDKPLLGHLSRPDVTAFRDALKAFYSVVKTQEGRLRFTFITGVSKFSKVSVFSDLNNLDDLTMDAVAATLFGYTHGELKRNFPGALAHIGETNGLAPEDAFNRVVEWYDGYRFHHGAEKVVNPVSFGQCAKTGELQNYWSRTAMTTFLTDALRRHPLDFSAIDVDQDALEAYEPENPRLVTLLYQTGYLTIRGFRQTGLLRRYDLCIPNLEVENSFLTQLAPVYAGIDADRSVNYQFAAADALVAGDAEKFVKVLRNFFANIPYNLTDHQNEQMWQTIVYVILRSIGVGVDAEVMTNEGRIDMTCETPAGIWLMEFKLDRPAEEALAQIDARNYADKYAFAGKKVMKLGLSFSSEKRTVVDARVRVEA
ncbi:MAG: AAA family ATPase [Kiritimatiellae bacterium]|nr:AAA family ATPase [Kiritimatiellia bacterium]